MNARDDWWKWAIGIILFIFLISYMIYGTIIPPTIKSFFVGIRGNTVEIDWENWDGTRCWDFDKKSNLMALDVLGDCRKACNDEHHLVAKDYFCDTRTGTVTCICGSPS